MPRRFVLLAAVLASSVLPAALPGALVAPAGAAAPAACAPTVAAPTGGVPTPGNPCFTDVRPYPFGVDGNAVDPADRTCQSPPGVLLTCYLRVDSLAFRAWNRGLAATSLFSGDPNASTAFGVWLFNGTRWYPDPTFPGQGVCKGNTVLWAGKRDYWLVGSRAGNWPSVCRFDGVNFEWQPLEVPAATLARVPLDGAGKRQPGAISAGACNTWDDCWLFGGFGTVVHWDGQALSDASPDLAAKPWLRGDATAAVARRTADGSPFALVTRSTGGIFKGEQAPPADDGSAPPELFGASGGAFAPLPFTPPTVAQPGDPYRTDLVAVDSDPRGRAWVAGDPIGYRAAAGSDLSTPAATERRVSAPEPSPLVPLTADGTPRACAAIPPDKFQYINTPNGQDAFLWSSIAMLGDDGDALAGGEMRPGAPGTSANADSQHEPVLVHARCGAPPVVTRFRASDPTTTAAGAPLVPADRFGAVTAVAATAANDAWAATTQGNLSQPFTDQPAFQAPHLYRLTDGTAPLGPAGDDDEPRPLFFQEDPPIIVEAPPDPEPAPAPDTTTTQLLPPVKKTVRLKAAVYGVKAKLHHKGGRLRLEITFKVRRPVTIGVEALRKTKVVSRSGLKKFTRKTGKLTLKLDRKHWPTRIRFVTPPAKPGATTTPAPRIAAVPRAAR